MLIILLSGADLAREYERVSDENSQLQGLPIDPNFSRSFVTSCGRSVTYQNIVSQHIVLEGFSWIPRYLIQGPFLVG